MTRYIIDLGEKHNVETSDIVEAFDSIGIIISEDDISVFKGEAPRAEDQSNVCGPDPIVKNQAFMRLKAFILSSTEGASKEIENEMGRGIDRLKPVMFPKDCKTADEEHSDSETWDYQVDADKKYSMDGEPIVEPNQLDQSDDLVTCWECQNKFSREKIIHHNDQWFCCMSCIRNFEQNKVD